MSPTTSTAVRSSLVEALRLDLVGPDNDHAALIIVPATPYAATGRR
jgi:hypothetical protein